MINEGDKVPSGLTGVVVVKSSGGFEEKEVKLDSYLKGKTAVLYFYPKDNTPGCTTEALAFQENHKKFEKLGVSIIGCSRDSVKSHCGFIEKKSLAFELLSDSTGNITESFGVWAEKSLYGKKYMGILRSTFIIKNGKIIKVYPKVKVKEHSDEVLEFIKGNI